jgi:membrane associated rhomboid family serine protease
MTREIREYPATSCFSMTWIVVFAAMLAVRLREQPAPGWWGFLLHGIGDGHRFGDLTLRDLSRGELWRLITCTFVHYSLIHIVLNLLAFFLLGTLVESWYGAPQFILIYGLTGGLGNLLSALFRSSIGAGANVHSGGGSVVIMGLIGLCAVMGWRSRSAMGSDLGWQMVKALGLTGLLGIVFPRYIDNWGHAGGVIVGASLGLMHGWFLRRYSQPSAWGAGIVTALVITGCGLVQVYADRRETPQRREIALRTELIQREVAYRNLRAALALLDRDANRRLLARGLDAAADVLDRGATRADYRRLRELAEAAAARVLSEAEKAEFKQRSDAMSARLRGELDIRLREFWNVRRKIKMRNR